MSNLRKITDTNLSREETDRILGKVIEAKFNAKLRKDWEQKLKEEFGIEKTPKKPKESLIVAIRSRKWLYLAAVAASLLLVAIAFNPFTISAPQTAQNIAVSYLEKTEIYHPGATKGVETETDATRQAAIKAFNAGQFPEAAQFFSSIADKTEQDQYHSALASLLSKHYDQSIAELQQLSATGSTTYREEINWYLSIALLLNDQEAKAKAVLSSIQADEWNFENAQALLKTMK